MMGTVGLSFGSPTSGAGFDVSSTVAAIVSNLQNVETPWKTQLTSLESQDTAISNLGTLFSNLSNDMNSLTDFQGVLAPRRLQLRQQRAGAYLGFSFGNGGNAHGGGDEPRPDLERLPGRNSDAPTLPTRSSSRCDYAAGGRQRARRRPITLNSSDNTLAGLAAAINSSGVGVTASVLTDSSGLAPQPGFGAPAGGNGHHIVALAPTRLSTPPTPTRRSPTPPASTGVNAPLTVDGVGLTSASNTVTNLIPGVTFQLLAPSAHRVRRRAGAGAGGHRQRQHRRRKHREPVRQRLQLADQRHQRAGRQHKLRHSGAALRVANVVSAAAATCSAA